MTGEPPPGPNFLRTYSNPPRSAVQRLLKVATKVATSVRVTAAQSTGIPQLCRQVYRMAQMARMTRRLVHAQCRESVTLPVGAEGLHATPILQYAPPALLGNVLRLPKKPCIPRNICRRTYGKHLAILPRCYSCKPLVFFCVWGKCI